MSAETPEGWASCKIGEVTQIVSGGTPPSKDLTNFTTEGGIPWITPADLSGYKDVYISRGSRNLSEKGFWACSATKIPQGSVLFSSRAPVGYVAIAANELTTNQGFKSFVLPKDLDSRFVYFYLKHIKPVAEAMATGTTFKELSGSVAAQLPLLIAPSDEQRRIADKLDSLLARVDACRDRLDRVSPILKQFRQSVINAATSGELTKDWVYTDNPEVWQEALVGDLLVEKPRNGYSPRAVEFETETRSLTLTATTSGRFNSTHIKYIDEKIPEDSYLWLEPDDILIQRANTLEYVGVSAIYDGPPKRYIYPDLMMKCRANSRVLTKFLYYLLSSDSVRSYFRRNATGTTGNMPKINQQTVISAPVWIPHIDEQQEIVRRVDLLFTYVDRLEIRYKKACAIVGHLTSALLNKAFRGDLVPQDPTDEPASVLLERIRTVQAIAKENAIKRQRKPPSDKPSLSQTVMLKRKDIQASHLSNILKVRGSMTAETLWSASQLEIDDFYDQLKDEEASGFLKEKREESTNAPRLLEAI